MPPDVPASKKEGVDKLMARAHTVRLDKPVLIGFHESPPLADRNMLPLATPAYIMEGVLGLMTIDVISPLESPVVSSVQLSPPFNDLNILAEDPAT